MDQEGTEVPPDADLGALLARIRAGDESAAHELLARYESQVRLVVRRQLPKLLRSRFDSLDFLQSVWGSFFRRMKSGPEDFEDPRSLVAFLARAARNKVIDEYRRAASQKGNMRREEPLWVEGYRPREIESQGDSPSEVVEAREQLGRLLDMVPEDRKAMVTLKAGGLSTREIGERLNVSERTVRRVLEDLRRRTSPDEEDPT
jgi:RNA polymerase sigma-70 factor (ECF subfamily)